MSILRPSPFPPPARKTAQLKETCDLLRPALKGRTIVSVTEERYVDNERRLLARMAERLQTTAKVVSYSQFTKNPESADGDILLLRTSKLFVVNLPEIVRALEVFRNENPGSAVIASVLDGHAFDVLTGRPDIVNLVDACMATSDHDLFMRGTLILEQLA